MKLTPNEAMSILELAKHPGISYADISAHKSGNIHIGVCSEINATLTDIDKAINDIFPGGKYTGVPGVHRYEDGTVTDLYTIATGTGLKINLHMVRGTKIAPAPTEAEKENIQPDCTTEEWSVEEILRNEG